MRARGSADAAEYEQLCRVRLEHLVEVREPLVLVSQIQRSGGTLLSQLFDGHPECHAHPSEIYIGYPQKADWPLLDLGSPGTWFDQLYESPVDLHLREGYVKEKESALESGHDVFPFLFLPALQREIFERCVAARAPETERDVLDCYFTSYFNAWLDDQNLYATPKRAVTGFTPGLAGDLANVERFFGAYPDGTLISIVRDPGSWYESARRYRPGVEELEEALGRWSRSTAATLEAAERFGDGVLVLTYDQLVLETEAAMRRVAEQIGISMSPVLLEPTFNGRPIRANSSVAVQEYGILRERTSAYRESLDPEAIARIEELGGELYAQAAELAARPAAGGREAARPVARPLPEGGAPQRPAIKLLFVMSHPAHVRLYGPILRLLDAHGHRVHLAFRRIKTGESHRVLWRLAEECPGVTFGQLPGRGSPGWVRGRHGWEALAERLRFSADYLRYLEPEYADAPGLRARAERKAQPTVRRLAKLLGPAGPRGVHALRLAVQALERCLVPPPYVERFLADQAPDVVLVSHLVELGSNQVEYVRAAKRLGLHTGYPVFSWDNLTNKGVAHELPELVLVWNDLQVTEAVELHGIPREQLRVTGAGGWDHWFEWQPSMSRAEFCHEVGLREDRPLILYVCSSHFIAPDEVGFVRRWLEALRGHGGLLAEAGVVIRPHPRNSKQWAEASFDDPQVTVWPRFGEEPLDEVSRQHFFDSIHHSGAVVGINTSAQIEAAIVGRPVLTLLADEFRDTQQGTLHFQYLKSDDFGHVLVGETLEQHLEQLEESLRSGADQERNERFLRRFVRPLGLDVPGTPQVVEALEELAARPAPKPARGPLLAPLARLALWPAAAASARITSREREAKTVTPTIELLRVTRRLGRDQSGAPVVAGPWLGDETAELLYWIPFLRWVQAVTFDLRDRLVIVSRAASAPWYAGLGSRQLVAEELPPEGVAQALGVDEVLPIEPGLVEERRAELAARRPGERSLNRLLEFAPPEVPDLPDGMELPDEFVAASFDSPAHAAALEAVLEDDPVVSLDGLDRAQQVAVIARASRFVGSWGPLGVVAALLGLPAVCVYDAGTVPADDLKIAASFLGHPPFGPLSTVEAGALRQRSEVG